MAVRTERIGDVGVIVPKGMLTGGRETTEVETVLRDLVQANQKKILLDLGETSHLASVAIGMLVGVHTSAAHRDLHFAVCNLEKRIQNVLIILKIATVLNVYDTRAEALKAFAAL